MFTFSNLLGFYQMLNIKTVSFWDLIPFWLKSEFIALFPNISSDMAEFSRGNTHLEFLAHHDTLTSLPNRLRLLFRLEHGIDTACRTNKQLAVLMLDLDHFKDVNDSFGHLAGDLLLQRVAQCLSDNVRNIDTVARLGGDEFTIVLEDISRPEDAAHIAQTIITELSRLWSIPGSGEVQIGASIGISLYPQHGRTAELLLHYADTALYKAKESGRNRFAFYSNEYTVAASQRLALEARLRRALLNNELEVYYQPQIDMVSGEIVGAEAFINWLDPTEGLISPAHFLPVAEHNGLIQTIGAWVLKEICRQGMQWLKFRPLFLAVNVSQNQLRQFDMATLVASVLKETGFPPEFLKLELPESILMEQRTKVVEMLHNLHKQGVGLAIDNFGTGCSSLVNLKRLPLAMLKIDKCFIEGIPHKQNDMEIAAAIIAMGHILGYKVLAVGVENQQQLNFLKEKGCDLYQGNLYSNPLPAEEITKLLQKSNSYAELLI